MGTDSKLTSEYLVRAYTEYQSLIRFADTKANIVLVLIGVIVSMFFNFFFSKNTPLTFSVYLILLPLILSGFFSFLTLYPRVARKRGRDSLLYFKDAVSTDLKKSLTALMNLTPQEIYSDYLINIKSLAVIIDKKFFYLRLAYTFLAVGVLVKILYELSLFL